jgi:hypothetical protein
MSYVRPASNFDEEASMLKIGFRCVNGTLASVAFGVLISGSAAAQDTPAPATEPEHKIQLTKPKPMIDLSTPAPSEPEGRTFHEHEGIYVRVNAGLGTLLSASAGAENGPDVDGSGLTLSYDLRVGFAPSPGFVLGGSILGATQLTGDWEIGSAKLGSGNLSYNVIGPFAEGFPDSHGNLNFGGTLGLAILSADAGDDTSAIGVGGAAWVGSGVWVAPDWSIGGLLRLDAATGTKDDVTLTVIALNAMFSVVFN